jgi:hypothetical protein
MCQAQDEIDGHMLCGPINREMRVDGKGHEVCSYLRFSASNSRLDEGVGNGKFTADEVVFSTVVVLAQIFTNERDSNKIEGIVYVIDIDLVVMVIGKIQKIYQ